VIRFLIGILGWAASCFPALAVDLLTVKDEAGPPAMRFEWHMESPTERCGKPCRTWISAVGFITEHTASDFEVFAKDNNVQGATLVLDSEGGSVLSALALGRAIRRFDMTTTVGRTIVLPSNDGGPTAKLSPDADCQSMCVFLLLGGTRRYVPPEARILVHMIWLGDKSKRAQDESYTAEELGLVQHDIGSIARYTVEMGGAIELLETALRVPPWKPLYALAADEVRSMRLTTIDRLPEEDVPQIAAQPPSQAVLTFANSNTIETVTQTHSSASSASGTPGRGSWPPHVFR
jgi:hypothetical protein